MSQENVPSYVDVQCTQEPDQRMSHQSDPTTLRGTREEPDLHLFLPQLIRKFRHSTPRTRTDSVPVLLQIIQKVDLPARVDSDLVTRAYGETRVIAGPEEHDAFAGGGIGLFIEGADYGEFRMDLGGVSDGQARELAVDAGGGFLAAGDVRAGNRRDAMLDVRLG